MDPKRAQAKAQAVADAYHDVFGENITRRELLFALCVAEHETHCGDDWKDNNGNPVHNWGAVQWRSPTGEELQRIKAGDLKKGDTIPGGILEQDTSPTTGPYYVFFRAFLSDRAGAATFLTVLYKHNPDARNVARTNGDICAFATAMYAHGYFEGFHPTPKELAGGMKPARRPFSPKGALQRVDPLLPAEAANVADYQHSIDALWPAFLAALHDFPLDAPGQDVASSDEINAALATHAAVIDDEIVAEVTEDSPVPAE